MASVNMLFWLLLIAVYCAFGKSCDYPESTDNFVQRPSQDGAHRQLIQPSQDGSYRELIKRRNNLGDPTPMISEHERQRLIERNDILNATPKPTTKRSKDDEMELDELAIRLASYTRALNLWRLKNLAYYDTY